MAPEQEALYALHWNVPRGELSMAAQLEYDRLRPAWEQGEARPSAGELEAARLAWDQEYPLKRDSRSPVRCAADRPGGTDPILGAIAWLITIVCPILGAVSAGIAITYQVSHHKLAGHLVGLGTVAGGLVCLLTGFGGPWWFRKGEKNKYDGAIAIIAVAGGLLGLIGLSMLGDFSNGP